MNYREELAQRLNQVPFSARRIAKEAAVSPAWVARAKNGTAHKITLETAQAINGAIDRLAARAGGAMMNEAPEHAGVVELAADRELRLKHHVTEDELAELSNLILLRDGQPVTLATAQEALAMLMAIRSIGPAPAR